MKFIERISLPGPSASRFGFGREPHALLARRRFTKQATRGGFPIARGRFTD